MASKVVLELLGDGRACKFKFQNKARRLGKLHVFWFSPTNLGRKLGGDFGLEGGDMKG